MKKGGKIMNKVIKTIGFLGLIVFVGLFAAVAAQAAITGSPHDFSSEAWNVSGEVCITCHTPHNADSVQGTPLWNHETTTATFTMYPGFDLDSPVPTEPSGSSKTCLSCHDGTVALDSFGGATGGTNMTGDALLGNDLSNDHPISFTYDAALATADGELVTPVGGQVGVLHLIGGRVECGTCHDVHRRAGDVDPNSKLLAMDNSGSSLCFTCHTK